MLSVASWHAPAKLTDCQYTRASVLKPASLSATFLKPQSVRKLWNSFCIIRWSSKGVGMNYLRLAISSAVLISMSLIGSAAPLSVQPPDWDSGLKLNEAADINPDLHIVEVNLEARIADVEIGGKHVQAWTYNGSL